MRPFGFSRYVLTLLWIAGVATGRVALGQHSAAAGQQARPPDHLDAEASHLMVFAHPRCPCIPAALRTLRFAGGLTPSRGHEGHTSGQDALVAALDAVPSPRSSEAPGYGCSLHDPS